MIRTTAENQFQFWVFMNTGIILLINSIHVILEQEMALNLYQYLKILLRVQKRGIKIGKTTGFITHIR